jgi:hypothetical protein
MEATRTVAAIVKRAMQINSPDDAADNAPRTNDSGDVND